MTFEEALEKNGYLVYRNVGISMRPLIREGKDMIVVRKLLKPLQKYDVVLFYRPKVMERGDYVLHRILKVNGDGTYWIAGDNCCSGETVKKENILGVLSEMVRGGKSINLDNLLYKIYVHLWCDCWPVRFFIVRYKSYPKKAVKKLLRMFNFVRK